MLVVPVLLGTILLVYGLVFLTPGDPIHVWPGPSRCRRAPIARSRPATIWISRSWCSLYYLNSIVHGDLGATFTGRDVSDIIKERFPVTLKLTLARLRSRS